MANSEIGTSTSKTVGGEYHVFLSFRGPDTRRTFTDGLHQALVDAGIHVFIDEEGLRPGEKISDLLQAIDNSKLYIPIFSKGYALSHWCLDELAKMVENISKHKDNGEKKVILPIFYDVKPNDVKLKTNLYKDAIKQQMEDQKKKFSSKVIETWQKVLKEVGGTTGWELEKYSRDANLIKMVVDEVVSRFKTRQKRVTRDLVGMEDRIAEIKKLLDIDFSGVRLIGIYGMGGIGKTTLAKIIFNELCHRFGKDCSFLDDVRETEEREDLVKLQTKLLSDISYLGAGHKIANIDDGINKIEDTICSKKMLIVLDDVNKADQIQKLIGEKTLYPGTRILVTTRDRRVLNTRESQYKFEKYEMVGLSSKHALRLFSRHAFNEDSPPIDYYTLSKGIVSTVNGLPLALQSIGSSLFQRKIEVWKEMLQKLKKIPHIDVMVKLKISYDALERNERQIFLDIACFFAGKNKTNPMYMWKDCEFYPEGAIEVLIDKCMIKELDNNSLWMHDQFRDLGRAIAKRERIGLWDEEDIICELRSRKNKESFQALNFSASWGLRTVTSEQIKLFPDLRILWLSRVICQGDFTDCLSELRWINLGYPFSGIDRAGRNQRLEATNLLHLEKAVVVNLSGLDITEDVFQSLIEGARKLKVLTINYNKSINRLSTFPEHSVLEKLDIKESILKEVDCSIGKLKWLTDLSIQSCLLRKLPKQIGELQNLRHLSLRSCINLIKLPDSVLKLKSLTELDVSLTKITRLPDSIGRLPSLSFVGVTLTPIEKLPSTMSKFRQLKTLNLSLCDRIQELPKLPRSLTTLQVTSSSLLTVPNLSYLSELVELHLSDGSKHGRRSDIIQTCDLWWIGKLSKLRKLCFCFPSVHAPTTELGFLSQLKELTLHGLDLPTFEQLPSNLIVLVLYETRGKQEHLDEQHDVQFPDVLESSERSSIQDCRSSERLVCQPEEPRCNEQEAPKLIDHRREAFLFPGSLKKLETFLLSGFPEVQDIQFVAAFESLEKFSIKECSSLKSLGGLSNSKNLKQLEIEQCPSLKFVEGIDELEYLFWLTIRDCRSMERIFDASSSKIPNKCQIGITRSGELLGSGGYIVSWESYREKILNETKQASDSEIETEDPLLKTGQENKENKRKRKTESAKQDGRRKRRKLQKKAWVRLFHPIISLCRTRKMKRRKEKARQSAKEKEKRKRGKRGRSGFQE